MSTTRSAALLLAALFSVLGGTVSAGLHDGTANGEWRYWGGDEASSRYSPLDLINADNFADLEIAWRWKADNFGPEVDYILRATPLYVNGKLYAVAGQRRSVVSIDPATGETLWMWRMKENPRWQKSTRKNYGKGVAWARVKGRDVIYVITPGYYMAALDADSGRPIPGFGINGMVDLHLGLGDYPVHPDRGIGDAGDITSSSPPIVVNGVIVVGNSHDRGYYPDSAENVPGHIRGYDAATGEMLWRFDVVPKPGQFGYDTWEDGSAEYTGNVSSWAPLSADSERGLVYLVTDTPTNDYYGGDRLGDNLFGTSILALDVKTGERRWHFQMVHHDVWNYDNPTAPKLIDVKMGRRTVPMVVETTKQGWAYVFNRETGEPIWPIEEREVPQSDVPGERLSPTQPFVTKPPPFELQGATEDDLIDFTPELREQALEIAANYRLGPIFNPPSVLDAEDGTMGAFVQPGANGGANIPGGSSVDPETGMLYVATERGHSVIALVPGEERGSTAGYVSTGPGGIRGPQGLELFKPPYGSVVAIDLKKGDKAWHIPNGDTPENMKNHPALEGVDLPRTGKRSHANILTTRSLVYYAEGRRGAPILHAVDKATGRELGEFELPAPGNTAPMTYRHQGRQYIIVSVGGPGNSGEFVALTVPED
ncbi:MAG: PQQ-binding-like beta-propeller repeat protein [Gammaproteobacteria bacterium]|nr:PQQ-binding-like beta-propeller repeat protein [Gammaproteobacteria bacterium]